MILVSARQVRALRAVAAINGGLLTVLVLALLYTVPRSVGYSRLVEENLALKERLEAIDRKMSELDRVLLRLRVYDAQLRSLTPRGDHGPIDLPDTVLPEAEEVEVPASEGTEPPDGPGLRDAAAWARSLDERASRMLERIDRSEPHLSDLVVQLEDLRALERALPKRWPARGHLSSGYGWRRNPVGRRGYRFHSGLDIANRRGTPIYATADGIVVRASYNSGYGRQVVIDHGFGITTSYSHCHRVLVREGQRVQEGQQIATIGSTGRSTGPHLHYEVHLDGNAVDPMDYLPRER